MYFLYWYWCFVLVLVRAYRWCVYECGAGQCIVCADACMLRRYQHTRTHNTTTCVHIGAGVCIFFFCVDDYIFFLVCVRCDERIFFVLVRACCASILVFCFGTGACIPLVCIWYMSVVLVIVCFRADACMLRRYQSTRTHMRAYWCWSVLFFSCEMRTFFFCECVHFFFWCGAMNALFFFLVCECGAGECIFLCWY